MLKDETNMRGLDGRECENVLERTHENKNPCQDRGNDVEKDLLVRLSSEKRLRPREMRKEINNADLRETGGNAITRTLTRTPQIENK